MYKLLGGLKDYLKWQDIVTDNAVFRLHNLFTTVLLLAFSLIVTATQYVGNPIQCIASGVPMKVINTYCWITSTFTMPDAFYRESGVEVAHPGVGPDLPRGIPGGGMYGRGAPDDPRKYYTYYQWVCFVLFFQAILCYTPKWLWDNWEGGLMRTIVMGLNVGLQTEKDKKKKKDVLIDYLLKHIKDSFSLDMVQTSMEDKRQAQGDHSPAIFIMTIITIISSAKGTHMWWCHQMYWRCDMRKCSGWAKTIKDVIQGSPSKHKPSSG